MPGFPMYTPACFFHICASPLQLPWDPSPLLQVALGFNGLNFYIVPMWNQPLPSYTTGSWCVLPKSSWKGPHPTGLAASLGHVFPTY